MPDTFYGRYIARPAIAQDWVSSRYDGKLVHGPKNEINSNVSSTSSRMMMVSLVLFAFRISRIFLGSVPTLEVSPKVRNFASDLTCPITRPETDSGYSQI